MSSVASSTRRPAPDAGDVDALTAIFQVNVDAVFNIAFRMLWSAADAEDVAQTTFVRAFSHRTQLERVDRMRPWLLQIAYRESIATMRRRRETPTDPVRLPVQVSTLGCPEEEALRTAVRRRVAAAIDALPERLRIAVVLRDVEGLAMTDVASVLGLGESATKMRVARGRDRLRLALEDEASR